MSTRSRAFPWFRDPVPIAKAMVEHAARDQAWEDRMYAEMGRALTNSIISARLNSKLMLQARLLDPVFDEQVRTEYPDLVQPLDPVSTAAMKRILYIPRDWFRLEDE